MIKRAIELYQAEDEREGPSSGLGDDRLRLIAANCKVFPFPLDNKSKKMRILFSDSRRIYLHHHQRNLIMEDLGTMYYLEVSGIWRCPIKFRKEKNLKYVVFLKSYSQ